MEVSISQLCPSSKCKPGSKLLGIRQESGMIAILPQALPIDENFVEKVKKQDIPPEQRFRFTNKCIENGCKQWDGKGCSVADRVVEFLNHVTTNEILPTCSIRLECRWFFQKGPEACKICPYILTEIKEEEFENIKE